MGVKGRFSLEQTLLHLVLVRLFLPLLLLILLLLAVMGYLVEKSLVIRQQIHTRNIVNIIDQHMREAERVLDSVLKVADVSSPSVTAEYMKTAREAYGYFDTLYLLGADGRIRFITPPDSRYSGIDMSGQPYFRSHPGSGNFSVSRPFISTRTGKPTVYLSGILSSGEMLLGELNLGLLQEAVIRGKNVGGISSVFIMDQTGTLVAHPRNELVMQQANFGQLKIFTRGLAGDTSMIYVYEGDIVMGNALKVGNSGWIVVAQTPLYTVFAPYFSGLGAVIILSIAIWAGLIWTIRRQLRFYIVEPMIRLSRRARALAEGDFAQDENLSPVPAAFTEVNDLAIDIEQMSNAVKTREAELHESEERFRGIFENAIEGIFRNTVEGRVVHANPALADMLGYESPDELINSSVRDFYVDPEEGKRMDMIFNRDGFVKSYELELFRKDGSRIWVSLNARALRDSSGTLYYEGIMENITERKLLEQQLLQSQKMEAVGQLAGGVAHDFNNILTALIGYGSLLCMRMKPEDPLKVYAENIVAVSEKAANITRSLLTFSRKKPVELKPLNLAVLVRDMEALLKRLLAEDIEFQTVIGSEEIPVMADAGCVNQILLNLSTNARDAMSGGGRFTITVNIIEPESDSLPPRGRMGRKGRYAEIVFSDTGCGMDEKTSARMFEPFFTTKDEGKGTGLGLSIVYGIVKEHNGFIEVESAPGKGSRFRIFLPAAGGLQHEQDESRDHARGGTETILIAEDHVEVRLFMRETLSMSGYTVIETFNGEDAVKKFIQSMDDISLLILDVVMPKKNGKEVYEEIRRYRPGIKVLFASGHTGETIDSKGVHVETVDFISKPMSAHELLIKVRELLDR